MRYSVNTKWVVDGVTHCATIYPDGWRRGTWFEQPGVWHVYQLDGQVRGLFADARGYLIDRGFTVREATEYLESLGSI